MAVTKKKAPAKRPLGRPRKLLTKEQQIEVKALFACGAGMHDVATYVGMTHDTLSRIMKEDKDFAMMCKRSFVSTKIKCRQVILKAMNDNPKWALHWLNMHDTTVIDHDKIDAIVEGRIGNIIEDVISTVSPEARKELADAIEKTHMDARSFAIARRERLRERYG